jgi:hypothetical protein
LIQKKEAYEKQKAAQAMEAYMCSGDLESLFNALPSPPTTVIDTVKAEILSRKVSTFLMVKENEYRFHPDRQRFESQELLAAARCFLHSLIRELRRKQGNDLTSLTSFLEANGASLTAVRAERTLAARCIVKMIPPCDKPHPLTEELVAAVEKGEGGSALRLKATGVLQGMDRCLYKEHPGRTALQMAAWAVSATLRVKEADEVLVEKAARYAHSKGIDVAGPLVEYILRRKY